MIIVDIGRENTKVLVEDGQRIDFPSVVGEGRELYLKNEATNRLSQIDLTINGVRYFIGELAEESLYRRGMRTKTKAHIETKILFATALYLSNYKAGEKVITLIPINQHRNKSKQDIKELLAGEYKVRSEDGGKQYTVHVEDIDIVPEGIAATWDMLLSDELKIKNEFLNRKIRSIEFGSKTTHFSTLIWKNGKFNYLDRESDTEDYGCMEIDKDKRAFVRRTKDSAATIWSSWKENEPVIMLGGGVLKLRKELSENYILPIFHDDPLFANVYGARKLGMIKYGKA